MTTQNATTATTIDGKRYEERSRTEWTLLPKLTCSCGQHFYQQVAGVVDCDDCISCDDARWASYAAITRAVWSVSKGDR